MRQSDSGAVIHLERLTAHWSADLLLDKDYGELLPSASFVAPLSGGSAARAALQIASVLSRRISFRWQNRVEELAMHISEDLYDCDRECLELTPRLLTHEPRTRTIRMWTGLSDDVIGKLLWVTSKSLFARSRSWPVTYETARQYSFKHVVR